jgi:hypothetical protein
LFSCSFATKRQLLASIVPEKSPEGVHTPASPYDMPFRVFTEQLQRIADQLSMAIEGLIAAAAAMARIHLYASRHTGVIHGDQYEILDQFSKVSFFRASPCFWRHSDAGMGSLLVCLQGPYQKSHEAFSSSRP